MVKERSGESVRCRQNRVKKELERKNQHRLMRKRMDRVSDERAGRGEIR